MASLLLISLCFTKISISTSLSASKPFSIYSTASFTSNHTFKLLFRVLSFYDELCIPATSHALLECIKVTSSAASISTEPVNYKSCIFLALQHRIQINQNVHRRCRNRYKLKKEKARPRSGQQRATTKMQERIVRSY